MLYLNHLKCNVEIQKNTRFCSFFGQIQHDRLCKGIHAFISTTLHKLSFCSWAELKTPYREKNQFCVRNTKIYKICKLHRGIFFTFYDILHPNFAILLTLGCSLTLLLWIVLFRTFLKTLSIVQSAQYYESKQSVSAKKVQIIACICWIIEIYLQYNLVQIIQEFKDNTRLRAVDEIVISVR